MTLKDQKPSGATARVAPTKNDKPFKCIYAKCPSSGFKTLGSKQRHEREQHGDDPKCRYCDYTAKRQYQMKQHVEADHRGQLEKPSADTSANRASHGSIDSYSSDESASSVPQHVGRLALERPSTNNQSFPTYTTNLNASQAYIASDIDVTQHPVAPSYAANVDPALFHSDYRTTASSPSGQRPSTTIQPSYSTMSQRDPAAQSSNTPWEETLIARPPIPSNFAYCNPPTTNPANQLDYTLSLGTLYNSGNNHGIHYDISPYSSPSSEQGTLYSPSTGSSHMGETRQQGNWSEQSPA